MLSHQVRYRVIYGDTDAMGVAYHANYLRWFEIGRTELLRSWGLPYKQIESAGYLLPVAEAQIKYHQPARYDDTLVIEATLDPTFKGGLKIDYRILDETRERLHATGYTRHACQNREGRVVRPPAMIREQLEKAQQNPS
ncbi:MAG: thioesterase family protein [Desulfosarcinaceae bacterium]|jgi:acyl-CoA thioester hydrolase